MSELVLPITMANLEECVELYITVFNSEPWHESWTYESAKERLTDLLNTPKFFGLLLYCQNELIGFIAGNSKKSYQGLTYYLAELCVKGEIQGKGYGSRLLHLLENELLKRNIKSLYLLTANKGAAEHFYKKNNYKVNENRIVMNKVLFNFKLFNDELLNIK